MISKYLSDIGIKEENLPWYWNPDDPRQEYWAKDREIYGFDERDTWALDYTMTYLIYPRLKMYNEINIINTDYHKFKYEGKQYTLQECINKILEGFEIYIKGDLYKFSEQEIIKIKDSRMLLGIIWSALWW